MANTLTALSPTLFAAARMVPRELVGYLGAINLNFDNKGVAKGDSVKVPVMPVLTAADVTPSATFASGSDRVATTVDLTLNNFKEVSWHYTAEQERSLMNGGTMQDTFIQTVQQGWRTLANTVELYMAGIVRKAASRAYGTAGTTPFATTIADLANANKILTDNGAPMSDRFLVMDTVAGVNFRSLSNLFKVNEAGGADLLRDDVLGRLYKVLITESAQVNAVTKGTGTGYLVNNGAGYAIGDTAITVDTGSGTILAGDVITLAGDTNKYVVKTALAANVVTLQEPGLRAAAADNTAITVGNNHTANSLLHKNAACAVVRPGLQPEGPLAEQLTVTDEVSGLSCLFLRVVQNAQTSYFMRIVYDGFAPNPFAIATLLG